MSAPGIIASGSRDAYFALSEEIAGFRDQVRAWVASHVAPYADAVGCGTFPQHSLTSAAEHGYMGIVVPAAYGGMGRDHLSFAIFVEEVAYACASTAVALDVHASVGTEPLILTGSDEQKARYLPLLSDGSLLGAFALTEPDAGSDAAALRTIARRDGDTYRLDGSKIFISNAGHAGIYTILAATNRTVGSRGISAFLVPADSEGLTVGPPQHKLGLLGSATAELVLRNCRVPVSNMLGPEGAGFRVAMLALDSGRIGISAQALGIARAALYEAIHLLKKHHGPDVPQGKQFVLADIGTHIEAARSLTWQAARDCDAGESFTTIASMAKLLSTDTAMYATSAAIDLVGDIMEPGAIARLERFFRDAKATQLYEGTNQIQRVVISRRLLGS
ncbi:MAG: Acyl-CoA dehydrogenase, short-chain specific [Chloroflexi bacterium]|nr:Acyl-CoA dehydrogenase, short-chain specific [Chloroflexota bacterium]